MAKPLVIVESGAKAKTIAGFLGADRYTVMASVGHIRDLPRGAKYAPKNVTKPEVRRLGIDVDDHFTPIYVVPDDKKQVVSQLKAALKDASELYLATDEDREGEAISWHLLEVLKPRVPVKRMVFHEITSEAIEEAIDNWRDLDMKLVEAQEGRRTLDRLYGFEVSNVAFRRSLTPPRNTTAHTTGSSVIVTSSDPISAKIVVSAIGLNNLPDGPVST